MPALFLGLPEIGAVLGALELDGTLHVGVIGWNAGHAGGGGVLCKGEGSQRKGSGA